MQKHPYYCKCLVHVWGKIWRGSIWTRLWEWHHTAPLDSSPNNILRWHYWAISFLGFGVQWFEDYGLTFRVAGRPIFSIRGCSRSVVGRSGYWWEVWKS